MPRGCADGGGGAGGEPGAAGAGMFGLSDADVDAAEARVLRLALGTAAGPAGTVENNDDGGGAAAAAAGVVWRSLERGRLQVRGCVALLRPEGILWCSASVWAMQQESRA
jgi:hypothetical protein